MDIPHASAWTDSSRGETATIDEIREAIAVIGRLNLKTASLDDVKLLVRPFFKGYRITTPVLDPGLVLYRLRQFPEAKPEYLTELAAPPAATVLKNQRCNRISQPLFYCSIDRATPFFELHAQLFQRFVLSTWRTARKLLVNNAGYADAAFKQLKSTRDVPTWGADKVAQAHNEVNDTIHEFVAKEFTQDVQPGDEHLYKITIALTEMLIRGESPKFDGILYPTIARWGNADNLALIPENVSDALEFVKSEFVYITSVDGLLRTFHIADVATEVSPEGRLKWRSRESAWTYTNPFYMPI